jgi:hypothetical protein
MCSYLKDPAGGFLSLYLQLLPVGLDKYFINIFLNKKKICKCETTYGIY